MNILLQNNYIKKSVAAFWLLLFAFLQLAKASHHHNHLERQHHSSYHIFSHSTLNADCRLCDLHLAENALLPDIAFAVAPLPDVLSIGQLPFEKVYSLSVKSFTGRGPPFIH